MKRCVQSILENNYRFNVDLKWYFVLCVLNVEHVVACILSRFGLFERSFIGLKSTVYLSIFNFMEMYEMICCKTTENGAGQVCIIEVSFANGFYCPTGELKAININVNKWNGTEVWTTFILYPFHPRLKQKASYCIENLIKSHACGYIGQKLLFFWCNDKCVTS